MPKLVAVLAGVALAFPLWSQEKPKEVAPTQPTFFSETIEVRVINVDVVVTDKKGQPVTGLTRNDFDLYQNGQRVRRPPSRHPRTHGCAGSCCSWTTPARARSTEIAFCRR